MRFSGFSLGFGAGKLRFMYWRKLCATASLGAIIASVALFLGLGLNFGIDFRGGVLMEAERTDQAPADIAQTRALIGTLGLGDVQIQRFGADERLLIRIESQSRDASDANRANLAAVANAREQLGTIYTIERVEVVGPRVSGELIQAGISAVLIALLLVLIYIWFRFEWQFSMGAATALTHDVLITIGAFSLLRIEFNLSIIAALLTIVGYSLNDTVVIYDRVRENMQRYKTTPMADILDMSLNQTLSRTLMTSITTALALLALYILGGETLRGFTFAMLWGVGVGTYSSIFVACPLLLSMNVRPPPVAGAAKQ